MRSFSFPVYYLSYARSYKQWKHTSSPLLPTTQKYHYSIFSPNWGRTLARSPHINIKRISLESHQYTTEPNNRLWMIRHHERRQGAFLVMVRSNTSVLHFIVTVEEEKTKVRKKQQGSKPAMSTLQCSSYTPKQCLWMKDGQGVHHCTLLLACSLPAYWQPSPLCSSFLG